MPLARIVVLAALVVLSGCRTETRWAIRVPVESRECTRDCEGAPDEPQWRECIAACGGDVSEGWCDGTTFHKRDPTGCRQAETSKANVWGTIVLVALLAIGGGVVLGGVAARNP